MRLYEERRARNKLECGSVHYLYSESQLCGKFNMKEKANVILYTRPGCHLCEEAKEQMQAANCADLYEFAEVNIESDPELVERYGWEIPVITINGILAFKHRLTSAEFKRAVNQA